MNRIGKIVALGLVSGSLGGCKGAEPAATDTKPAGSAPRAPSAPSSSAAAASVTAAAVTPAAPAGTSAPPTSFAGGTKVDVENAVGVGCETKSLAGWLELLCYKRNGTGGHPLRATLPPLGVEGEATVDVPAPDGGAPVRMRVIEPEASGMMHVVVPWNATYSGDGTIEWSDTTYVLHVDKEHAKLGWTVTLAMRKACATLEHDQQGLVDAATRGKPPGSLTSEDSKKLPHFGRCQPAGRGSWAVTVSELAAVGEGPTRHVRAALDMVWVDFEGKSTKAPLGAVEFSKTKFSLPRLVAYDYDGDGRDEGILNYEIEATPAPAQTSLPPIWTYDGSKVSPYEKAPVLGGGGVSTEQLDADMRPDLGSYGPFVAWPSAACGAAKCPERLTGPRLFAHSLPGGDFSLDDEAARSAARRACSSRPSSLVAMAGAVPNIARTAQNVACARLWGVDEGAISTELAGAHDKLCAQGDCELLTVLTSFARAKPPFVLK